MYAEKPVQRMPVPAFLHKDQETGKNCRAGRRYLRQPDGLSQRITGK